MNTGVVVKVGALEEEEEGECSVDSRDKKKKGMKKHLSLFSHPPLPTAVPLLHSTLLPSPFASPSVFDRFFGLHFTMSKQGMYRLLSCSFFFPSLSPKIVGFSSLKKKKNRHRGGNEGCARRLRVRDSPPMANCNFHRHLCTPLTRLQSFLLFSLLHGNAQQENNPHPGREPRVAHVHAGHLP